MFIPTCSETMVDSEADHLPDPGTLRGTLDLFAFCFLVIFGNVLDFRTYTNARGDPLEEVSDYDQNGISVEERINMCQARGVCLQLLQWWTTNYTAAVITEGGSIVGFTTLMLMTQAAAMVKYMRYVQQDDREGAPGCTFFLLNRQIENVISLIAPHLDGDTALRDWDNWGLKRRNLSRKTDCDLGFSFEDWDHIKVSKRTPPLHYGKLYILTSPDEI